MQFGPPEEEKQLYGAETLFREIGIYQKVRKQYEQSLEPFNEAIKVVPDDRRALLGRSYSRAKTTNFKCALEDVQKALNLKPDDLNAFQQRALYIFMKTNFEDAFVENIRGIPLRQQPPLFIIGALECEEEIERCIGKRGGHNLRDHYDIIRKIAWKKAADLRKGFQYKPRFKKRRKKVKKTDNTPAVYTKFVKDAKHKTKNVDSNLSILESLTDHNTKDFYFERKPKSEYQPPQRRTTNIRNFMAERYMNKMCLDKIFLEDLKEDARLACPNKKGAALIRSLAKSGFKRVSLCEHILRTRLPFYSIKYNEIVAKGAALERQLEELRKLQVIARRETHHVLAQLSNELAAHRTNKCILTADRAKTFIDKKTLKILPDKEEFLKTLYQLMGLVYLDVYRLKDTMTEYNTAKRINFSFGLPISREASDDSVVKNNQKEFTSAKKAVVHIEKRLVNATTPLETVWLYYDLARFSMDLKKWDLSRYYARKSLNMAKILKNFVWATNSSMLIARSHVLQQNKNEAKNQLMSTKQLASKLDEKEAILKYINKCIQMVQLIDFHSVSTLKVVQQREEQILKTITGINLQTEIAHLFQMMTSIPGKRRMSIMPGVIVEDDKLLSRKSSGKESIKPRSKADLEFEAQVAAGKDLEQLVAD